MFIVNSSIEIDKIQIADDKKNQKKNKFASKVHFENGTYRNYN